MRVVVALFNSQNKTKQNEKNICKAAPADSVI